MINRIISMVLTFAIIVSGMVVSVSADEPDNWVQILNYSTANDSGTNRLTLSPDGSTKTRSASFVNPNGYSFGIGEILFSTDDTSPEISVGGSYITVIKVFGNTYRAYGNINTADLRVGIRYTDGTYLQIYSFRTCISRYDWDYCPVYGNVIDRTTTPNTNYYINYNSPGNSTGVTWNSPSTDFDHVYSVALNIEPANWRKYDYIELIFSGTFTTVSSILSYMNELNVPCEATYLGNDSGYQEFLYSVRINLTNVNKQNNVLLNLEINGLCFPSATSKYEIESCIGYVQYENLDLISYWFLQLRDWFNELISAVGGNADTSEMENEVDNIKDQMQNASDIMGDFTRPDVDEVFQNVELDIGNDTPFADMMRAFFENEFIVSIITGSLAFTLFGILVG